MTAYPILTLTLTLTPTLTLYLQVQVGELSERRAFKAALAKVS